MKGHHLYSGVDGRELEADIFIGVVYYQRLRHMVSDKFQVCILHSNKRDDFNFPIVNFPFIFSNISAAPAYGVYISQLIRYSRACGSYQDFLDRGLLQTRKLLNQGFLLVKLKSSLRTFYSRHHDLVDHYGIFVSNDHGYVPLVVNTYRSFPHS